MAVNWKTYYFYIYFSHFLSHQEKDSHKHPTPPPTHTHTPTPTCLWLQSGTPLFHRSTSSWPVMTSVDPSWPVNYQRVQTFCRATGDITPIAKWGALTHPVAPVILYTALTRNWGYTPHTPHTTTNKHTPTHTHTHTPTKQNKTKQNRWYSSALHALNCNSTRPQYTLQICLLTTTAQDKPYHEKPLIRVCCNHKGSCTLFRLYSTIAAETIYSEFLVQGNFHESIYWNWRDSNSQPLAPKASAVSWANLKILSTYLTNTRFLLTLLTFLPCQLLSTKLRIYHGFSLVWLLVLIFFSRHSGAINK